MNQDAKTKKYLQTQIATASPEQLLLMLYDGAIRFLGRGREFMVEKKYYESHEDLIRVQKIVVELMCSLDREKAEELSGHLTSLYLYMYQKLIEANVEKNLEKIDEVTSLLTTLRSGWREAVQSLRTARPSTGTDGPGLNPPQAPGGGISLQG